jgi:hypothetical protein
MMSSVYKPAARWQLSQACVMTSLLLPFAGMWLWCRSVACAQLLSCLMCQAWSTCTTVAPATNGALLAGCCRWALGVESVLEHLLCSTSIIVMHDGGPCHDEGTVGWLLQVGSLLVFAIGVYIAWCATCELCVLRWPLLRMGHRRLAVAGGQQLWCMLPVPDQLWNMCRLQSLFECRVWTVSLYHGPATWSGSVSVVP